MQERISGLERGVPGVAKAPRGWRPAARAGALVRIAFLVAIAATGLSQPRDVHSASASGAPIRYSMNLVAPRTTLCTGETVVYTVQVLQSYVEAPRGWTGPGLPQPVALSRVVVNALARDASIGKFRAPQTRSTSLIASPDGDEPPNSTFTFTASKNPGKSVLYFDGMVAGYDIHTDYVDFNVPITVIHCKYKVSASSQWVFSTPYGTGFVFAFIKKAALGIAPGQTESGSLRAENVPVAWVGYNRIPNYGSFVSLNYGTASITGKVLDDQLQVKIEFSPMTGSEQNCGAPGCGGGDLTLAADPLSFLTTVGGGTSPRIANQLIANGMSVPGGTVVTVSPVEASK